MVQVRQRSAPAKVPGAVPAAGPGSASVAALRQESDRQRLRRAAVVGLVDEATERVDRRGVSPRGVCFRGCFSGAMASASCGGERPVVVVVA